MPLCGSIARVRRHPLSAADEAPHSPSPTDLLASGSETATRNRRVQPVPVEFAGSEDGDRRSFERLLADVLKPFIRGATARRCRDPASARFPSLRAADHATSLTRPPGGEPHQGLGCHRGERGSPALRRRRAPPRRRRSPLRPGRRRGRPPGRGRAGHRRPCHRAPRRPDGPAPRRRTGRGGRR